MKKLRNTSGETIGEVLVALLISAMALLMLATMIASSTKLIANSKTTLDQYYDANNNLAQEEASSLSGTATFSTKLTDSSQADISVNYYVNSKAGGTVVSYQKAVTP